MDPKNILELSNKEVYEYLMNSKCYTTLELPEYFDFTEILNVAKNIESGGFAVRDVKASDGVNHCILHNKDGAYAWRPFQLVHPVLYARLVKIISEDWGVIQKRFDEFKSCSYVECMSIPLVQDTNMLEESPAYKWWKDVEQRSLCKSLEYKYVAMADISDCYGAIYTHSIAWAIHGKEQVKERLKGGGIMVKRASMWGIR